MDVAEIDAEIKALKKGKTFEDDFKKLSNKRKDALNKLRKKHGIKVEGDLCPEPLFNFQQVFECFDNKPLAQSIRKCGYKKPTPVQMQALPIIKERRSAIVLAETGSGKSAAFAIPLLNSVKRGSGLKAVVLAPTRELTIQLYKEFLILSETWINKAPRVRFLRKGMVPKDEKDVQKMLAAQEILIASPLKFAQLCELYPVINTVEVLVIDEADKMFEMGFLE